MRRSERVREVQPASVCTVVTRARLCRRACASAMRLLRLSCRPRAARARRRCGRACTPLPVEARCSCCGRGSHARCPSLSRVTAWGASRSSLRRRRTTCGRTTAFPSCPPKASTRLACPFARAPARHTVSSPAQSVKSQQEARESFSSAAAALPLSKDMFTPAVASYLPAGRESACMSCPTLVACPL